MEQTIQQPPASVEAIAHSFVEADEHESDLTGYQIEDWLTAGMFWIMASLVFLQFFTRYVMNDSFAWTEELAVNCLIAIVFVGSAMCIRKDRHIQVDILYRFLPAQVSRVLSTVVDVIRAAFLAYATALVWKYIQIVGDEPMTTLDWPKSMTYWFALAGFALMTIHALRVAVRNWRQGYSILEKPEAYDGTETN
ncbi:MAG: tripartite ATP-independent periplasmic transporter, DctQ component family protein 12 [Burkholderia sp.]|nr:tripartite ATP-independent periplasmic transporter, DctQ component family protein 12 [Burkholderia sp.]